MQQVIAYYQVFVYIIPTDASNASLIKQERIQYLRIKPVMYKYFAAFFVGITPDGNKAGIGSVIAASVDPVWYSKREFDSRSSPVMDIGDTASAVYMYKITAIERQTSVIKLRFGQCVAGCYYIRKTGMYIYFHCLCICAYNISFISSYTSWVCSRRREAHQYFAANSRMDIYLIHKVVSANQTIRPAKACAALRRAGRRCARNR